MKLTLDKTKRICKRRTFLQIQRFGRRSFGKHLVLVSKRLKAEQNGQFGITVSKSVGKAHERNKIKRQFRHIIRLNQHIFQDKLLVIMARPSAKACAFDELSQELLFAYKRLNKG
jgi:ribonuclease P protein component